MADPIAHPEDVRRRLNLPDTSDLDDGEAGISDADIHVYLEDAAFDIQQATDFATLDDDLRKQLEWRLAGIKILSTRRGQRAYHQQSLGSMSRSYEVKSVEELKEWVRNHGPSGLVDSDEFWHATVNG